jgi:hypothetical protein
MADGASWYPEAVWKGGQGATPPCSYSKADLSGRLNIEESLRYLITLHADGLMPSSGSGLVEESKVERSFRGVSAVSRAEY